MKILRIFLCLCVIFSLVGCSSSAAQEDDKPVVFASFFPIYDLVADIGGDEITAETFMPADKDPHLWEPTPKDMQRLAEADLLVVNGANFEPWLSQVRDALPNLEILTLSDYVELITYKGASAIGEFQYLARPSFAANQDYTAVFGHTHEKFIRYGFFNNKDGLEGQELIDAAKALMEDEGQEVGQDKRVDISKDSVFKVKMGHESGQFDFRISQPGDWLLVSDRVSENLLPYHFTDSSGNRLEPEELVQGSSAETDEVTFDPHSWISLVNAKRYANAINDTLRAKYPENDQYFSQNKFNLVKELSSLHNEYRSKFKGLDNRTFVVSHNAYEYLSRDFQLKQYPLQGLTSFSQPSVRTLIDAIYFARDMNLSHIYYEYGSMPLGADTVADEVGAELVPLASMEFVSPEQANDSGEDGYVGYMRMNLDNLYRSLNAEDNEQDSQAGKDGHDNA